MTIKHGKSMAETSAEPRVTTGWNPWENRPGKPGGFKTPPTFQVFHVVPASISGSHVPREPGARGEPSFTMIETSHLSTTNDD